MSYYPIEMLPIIFRYGFAMPFYNVSDTVRAVVFNTKNQSTSNIQDEKEYSECGPRFQLVSILAYNLHGSQFRASRCQSSSGLLEEDRCKLGVKWQRMNKWLFFLIRYCMILLLVAMYLLMRCLVLNLQRQPSVNHSHDCECLENRNEWG